MVMILQHHALPVLWLLCIGLSTWPQASALQPVGNDGEVLLQTTSEIHRVGLNGSVTEKETVGAHCLTRCTEGVLNTLMSELPVEIMAVSDRARFQMTTAMDFEDPVEVGIGGLTSQSGRLWYWDDLLPGWLDAGSHVTGVQTPASAIAPFRFFFSFTRAIRILLRLKRILLRHSMCFAYQDMKPDDNDVPPDPPMMDSPGAVGDPHITNLKGEHFDINQPGKHLLLRAPLETQQPALLELSAEVETDGGPCSMFVKMATLSGTWLGDKVVRIRPRQRDGTTFALQVSAKGHEGSWKPWGSKNTLAEVGQSSDESLPEVVRVSRERHREGKMKWEAHVFVLHVGNATNSEDRAEILVSESPHYALDITLNHMKRLGELRLGGILGTEGHDTSLEELTEECEAKKRRTSPKEKTRATPYLAAFWASDDSVVDLEREIV